LVKRQPEIIRLIYYYRYLTLMMTIFYFLSGATKIPADKMWFIVGCITMSSIILNNLFLKAMNSKPKTLLLIFIETVSNSLILIPAGSLSSPFAWHAMNTVLIASVKLPVYYCWINLAIYLLLPMASLYIIRQPDLDILTVLGNESNIMLSLVLITVMIQILAKYNNKLIQNNEMLTQLNGELVSANNKIKGYINYIMDMYNAVQLISSQSNKNNVYRLIAKYASKILKSGEIIIFEYTNQQHIPVETGTPFNKFYEKILLLKLPKLISDPLGFDEPMKVSVSNQTCYLVPIKSNYRYFGTLGIVQESGRSLAPSSEIYEQMAFISRLSSTVLEKLDLAQLNEKLAVNEEQNRIANEIHDSVLQRLFSASCALYTIMKKLNTTSAATLEDELNAVRTSINDSMKDLRSTIYGLSWKKNGSNLFLDKIYKHINEIRSLNKVDIKFDIEGSHDLLTTSQKYALFRIICEGISNAVRHGKATLINILLEISNQNTVLSITDNGIGFDIGEKLDSSDGMGLDNIRRLAESLCGSFAIDSGLGSGTKITVIMPNIVNVEAREVVV